MALGYTFIPLDDFEPRSAHHDDLRATLQAYALQTYGEAGPPAREVARGARAAVMEVMARGGTSSLWNLSHGWGRATA